MDRRRRGAVRARAATDSNEEVRAMPQSHVYHVVPVSDGRWAARLEGDGTAPTFRSREEALQRAREQAAGHEPSQVVLHRADGSIEERWSGALVHRDRANTSAEARSRDATTKREEARSRTARGREPEPTRQAVRSRTTIAGHPVHPMLVAFPVATLALLPVSDIAYWATRDLFWARLSWFFCIAGLSTAGLAALVGLVDFLTLRAVRNNRVAWFHFLSNGAVVGLTVANLLLRVESRSAYIAPQGTILSLIAFGLLVVGGWLGGELAYRYRIGVIPDERDLRPRAVKT
jgi:uncharacterized membrane protein